MAASLSTDPDVLAKAALYKGRNQQALPQKKLTDKLKQAGVAKNLRFENVYNINLHKMQKEDRAGE
jgi:hypothetical protein